jgi:hypothetical protein
MCSPSNCLSISEPASQSKSRAVSNLRHAIVIRLVAARAFADDEPSCQEEP